MPEEIDQAHTPRSRAGLASSMLLAGAAGLMAFEVVARFITPVMFGARPVLGRFVALATGFDFVAHVAVIHILTGLLVLPTLYVLTIRRLGTWILPGMPWWGSAAGYAVFIWIISQAAVLRLPGGAQDAPSLTGNALASFFAYTAYAMTLGAVAHLLRTWRPAGAP